MGFGKNSRNILQLGKSFKIFLQKTLKYKKVQKNFLKNSIAWKRIRKIREIYSSWKKVSGKF